MFQRLRINFNTVSVRHLYVCVCVCVCVCELSQCLTVCCTMACSLPGFSAHGIFQERILEQAPISISRDVHPGIKPVSLMSLALAGRFHTTSATWEA